VKAVPDRFERRAEVLWRDTGERVLALPPGTPDGIALLGGGSAVLWRRLTAPHTLAELTDTLLGGGDRGRTEAEIAAALEALVIRGLVRVRRHE
jgi:hypothetical protein